MPGKRGEFTTERLASPDRSSRDAKARRAPALPPEATTLPPSRARAGSSFAARFGRVILAHGIAAIPSALYHYQGRMKLKIQHIWFVSYILSHKWDEDLPYPSLKKMNRSTNIDLRYLQRIRGELCGADYLEVGARHREERGQDTNTYDFSGLFDRLEKLIVADASGVGSGVNPIREEGPAPDLVELAEIDSSFVARYGRIIMRRGVAAVPRAIFTHHAALGLTLQQVWFTTYIFSFQWDTALPYPSLEKMAEQTGYSRTHLHEIKANLVERGFLRLIPRVNAQGGRDSNAYDFSGLLDAIRAQLQPPTQVQPQRSKAESNPAARGTASGEIPDLRRVRKSTQHETAALQAHGGGGLRTTGEDGSDSTWGGGQESTPRGGGRSTREGGLKRTDRGGQEGTEGDGAGNTGAGGRQSTSSVYHESPRGAVHTRHKEETDNIEPEKDDSNHISASINVPIESDNSVTQPRPIYSPYVAQVVSDFSDELRDSEHMVSNVTQALRLWQLSGLDEQEFIGLLYEAKTLTRKYQGKNGLRGIENKMAYFFRVLRGLIGEQGATT